MATFHIDCDESCHLEHDHATAMVLGAIRCPADKRRAVSGALRDIKVRHGLDPAFELKWTKISPAKVAFYKDAFDYFMDSPGLAFRAALHPEPR
jgi:hypothetical protein